MLISELFDTLMICVSLLLLQKLCSVSPVTALWWMETTSLQYLSYKAVPLSCVKLQPLMLSTVSWNGTSIGGVAWWVEFLSQSFACAILELTQSMSLV